jgi:hypothetical protein
MEATIKRLIRDYIYNLETLIDVKDISSNAENLFKQAMMIEDPLAMEALTPKDIKIPNEDDIMEKEIINNGIKFKKLFRKAAVVCHPDKLNSSSSIREFEFMKSCYSQLTEANDTNDWGLLLKVSIELDIDIIELDEDEISNISGKINDMKSSISQYENSMAYSWYNQKSEEQKKLYLAECAAIFKRALES